MYSMQEHKLEWCNNWSMTSPIKLISNSSLHSFPYQFHQHRWLACWACHIFYNTQQHRIYTCAVSMFEFPTSPVLPFHSLHLGYWWLFRSSFTICSCAISSGEWWSLVLKSTGNLVCLPNIFSNSVHLVGSCTAVLYAYTSSVSFLSHCGNLLVQT